MRMRVIQDIDSGKILAGPEINHGDFPFRFMIRVQYTEEWAGEKAVKEIGKYIVGLHVVSPSQAKLTDAYQCAMNSYGWTEEDLKRFGPYAPYEMLLEYGTAAHLWESSGNNISVLMAQCRSKLKESDVLFGFAMDRTENAIGTTGWDAVKGDILAPLRSEPKEEESAEKSLMRKLSKV